MMQRMFLSQVCLQFLLLCIFTINAVLASQSTPLKQDFFDVPLEELLKVKISTVSRKPQTLSETAAAVFVISQEDIRRSSANSIPELLRMAPGLSVARIDGNKWSVTSRGYSGRFADDLISHDPWANGLLTFVCRYILGNTGFAFGKTSNELK